MRKFFSYGPLDTELHYYAQREDLISRTYTQLLGENPVHGGHYITIWAPRQTGKTWTMQQILFKVRNDEQFDVLKLNLEHLKRENNVDKIVESIANEILHELEIKNLKIKTLVEFHNLFTREVLKKPLILILDEFDALAEDAISGLAGVFRNIYIWIRDDLKKRIDEKKYLLHGVALIGVRSVLGIENEKGSPFNVQRSLHIPNLTFDEVDYMFTWYEKESGQKVEQEVVNRLYYEMQGHPGLTCWFGELLTETYNSEPDKPITIDNFEEVYGAATYILPNNTMLNIISKAKQEPYRELVIEMFRTDEKINFRYDDKNIHFLYMNGIIDWEKAEKEAYYVKFASPFVQKRLFNYFSNELFKYMGRLVEPFESLDDTITDDNINIRNLIKRYQKYLKKNREWLFKGAPRRKDLRFYEAVFHFNVYTYLFEFLKGKGGIVYPEFPTGNGKIDIVIKYADTVYGIELKSFTDDRAYKKSIKKAASYGKQLSLSEML